jgi:hypothetical protein
MIHYLVECADHSFAPFSFLCNHLLDNPNQNWVSMEVQDGREVENDFLCEECAERFEAGEQLEEVLAPVCINCVRCLKGEE